MNGFPWLTVAGAVPLLGAIVIALIPGLPADSAEADRQARNAMAKVLALGFSLVTLVVVIIIAGLPLILRGSRQADPPAD